LDIKKEKNEIVPFVVKPRKKKYKEKERHDLKLKTRIITTTTV